MKNQVVPTREELNKATICDCSFCKSLTINKPSHYSFTGEFRLPKAREIYFDNFDNYVIRLAHKSI